MAARNTLDYYAVLGVASSATQEEIRAAYKSKSIALHPDKNLNDPSATAKFQDLVEAYMVLRDTEKRRMYDAGESFDDDEGCSCPNCGRPHQGSFRSFFAQFFNSQFGYDAFDDDDRYERYQRNFWKQYASRDRFAADWGSIPPTPSERELRQKGVPDKPSKPKATVINKSIRVEWAKKAPRKIVTEYVLQMKKAAAEFGDIYKGPEREFVVKSFNPHVPHHFRVKAGNESGFSDFSETVSITPVEEITKEEEEVAPMQAPAKKKKKKAAPVAAAPTVKSKASKFLQELNEAVEARDGARIEKVVSQASKLGDELTPQVRQAIDKAQYLRNSKKRVEEIEAVRSTLSVAVKSQTAEELEQTLVTVSQFLKHATGWKEEEVGELRREYNEAKEQHNHLLHERVVRDELVKELDRATAARNLSWLSRVIEEAKAHGVRVKHAKKVERLLIAEQAAKKQLEEAVDSGDCNAIKEAIAFVNSKPFQLNKEVEYALAVVKVFEETPVQQPTNSMYQTNNQAFDSSDYVFLERYGMLCT